MITQVEHARNGNATAQMEEVAKTEGLDLRELLSSVAQGSAVIMCRDGKSVGIGKGLKTKVNVNIGTSSLKIDPEEESNAKKYGYRYGDNVPGGYFCRSKLPGVFLFVQNAYLLTTSFLTAWPRPSRGR